VAQDFTNREIGLDDGRYTDQFYIVLYWYPEYLGLNQDGGNSTGIVGFDPLSYI
jgi:hypothetical protein